MSLTIGCANCAEPFSFMLDETLGGARCPYCGAISTFVNTNAENMLERESVLVEGPPNVDHTVSEL